jgi:chromosome segregation ATPase
MRAGWESQGDINSVAIVTKAGKKVSQPKTYQSTHYGKTPYNDSRATMSWDELYELLQHRETELQELKASTSVIISEKDKVIRDVQNRYNAKCRREEILESDIQNFRAIVKRAEPEKQALEADLKLQKVLVRSLSETVGSFYESSDLDLSTKTQKAGELFAKQEAQIQALSQRVEVGTAQWAKVQSDLEVETRRYTMSREEVKRLETKLVAAERGLRVHQAEAEQLGRVVEDQKRRYETAESHVKQLQDNLSGHGNRMRLQREHFEYQLSEARNEFRRQTQP